MEMVNSSILLLMVIDIFSKAKILCYSAAFLLLFLNIIKVLGEHCPRTKLSLSISNTKVGTVPQIRTG